MNKREEALELFKSSGIKDTPYNWHIWKRAFNLGWASNKTNPPGVIDEKDLSEGFCREDQEEEINNNSCFFYMPHLFSDENNLYRTTSMEKFEIKSSAFFKSIAEFFNSMIIDFATSENQKKEIATSYGNVVPLLGTKKLLQLEYIKLTLEIFFVLFKKEIIKEEDFVIIIENFCKSKIIERATVKYSYINFF